MHTGGQSNLTISQFYIKVIDTFQKKLYQKYHQKEQGFDAQMIDQISQRVKNKISEAPDIFFNKALQIKHCSSSNQLVIQVNKLASDGGEVKKQEEQINQHVVQQVDYANAFEAKEAQVKKQQADQNGIIKHEPNDDLQDQKDEQDQRQKREAIQKVKSNISLHIVGTYEPKAKKHVAKDQSTRLQLQNVFIKCKNREQIFIPKLHCQFKKD